MRCQLKAMVLRTIKFGVVLLLLCVVATGCRSRRAHDCSGIQTQTTVDPLTVLGPGSDGVSVSFDVLEDTTESNLTEFFSSDPLGVSLQEAYCLAARNSRLANLIDQERKAICCESGCIECVDKFLAGQASEQRNKSAADAGELLIRLAGVQLQSEILEQSTVKMAQLQRTIDAANENGMATAEAQSELDKRWVELRRNQAELRAGIFAITNKLSLLLGLDSCNPRLLLPSHHFNLEALSLDAEALIIDALCKRPELRSLSGFGACSGDESCLAVLANVDRRLGIAASQPITRFLLCAKRKQRNRTECCCHLRQKQINDLRSSREELIRQQVLENVKDVQLNYETLALENQNIQRLVAEARLIDSAAAIDASKSFIDSIENFAQQQLAKSQRIDAMVEFEVAKIRLHESTGQLPQVCCPVGN